MTPGAKRQAVERLCEVHGVSERRACSALNVDRWTLPIGFGVMVLIGGLSQLVLKRPKKHQIEREIVREIEESEAREPVSDKEQLKKAFLKKRV